MTPIALHGAWWCCGKCLVSELEGCWFKSSCVCVCVKESCWLGEVMKNDWTKTEGDSFLNWVLYMQN